MVTVTSKPDVLVLPKLQVGIYEGETLVRVVEMDDPRQAFITSWLKKKRDGVAIPLPIADFIPSPK